MSQKRGGFVRSKHEFHCITQLNACWQHKEMERRKGSFVRQCHDSSTQSDHEERSCTIGNRWKWRCGRSGAWRVNKQKIRETEREAQVEKERQRWAHTLTVEIVSRVSTEHVDCGGMAARRSDQDTQNPVVKQLRVIVYDYVLWINPHSILMPSASQIENGRVAPL